MNVAELREKLASMPDHWTVIVEQTADGSGGWPDVELMLTLDCERSSLETYGNFALILLGDKTKAQEVAK